MSKNTTNNVKMPTGLQWLISPTLYKKNVSHKIAYIAIMTAFCIVLNMLEIKLGAVQLSFTIAISAVAGLVLGGGAGGVLVQVGHDALQLLVHFLEAPEEAHGVLAHLQRGDGHAAGVGSLGGSKEQALFLEQMARNARSP